MERPRPRRGPGQIPDLLRRGVRIAALVLGWWAAVAAGPPQAFAANGLAGESSRTEPEQVIRVEVQGAVAAVSVTRTLQHCDGLPWAQARARGECVLDIVLPSGAALLDVQIRDGRASAAIAPMAAPTGLERYRDALHAAHIEPSAIPFDDDARYRVRVLDTASDRNRAVVLRYSFAAPVEIAGNLAFISFPPSPELSPPETRVEVIARTAWPVTAMAIGGQRAALDSGGSGGPTAAGMASTRTTWRVELTLGTPRGADPKGRVVVLASRAEPVGSIEKARRAVAVGVRSFTAGEIEALPDRVLFVIDRSRSVGPGGLEAERELALQLLRRLPPSTRFDAVFFDRHQKRLFPVARPATRQAMAALAEEMVSDRLANGTDLVGAIEYATELLRREAADFGPRTLLAVLTDGAIGAAGKGSDPWTPAFKSPLPGLDVAVLSIRANDDPAVSADERARLGMLASQASIAGLEASMQVGELTSGLDAALEALRAGGSVFAVGMAAGDSRPRPLTSDIAAGQGFSALVEPEAPPAQRLSAARASIVRGLPLAIHFQYRAAKMSVPLLATPVPERLLSALSSPDPSPLPSGAISPVSPGVSEPRSTPRGEPAARDAIRCWVTPRLAALWEPVVRPAASATADDSEGSSPDGSSSRSSAGSSAGPNKFPPRGFMERSVVRDALSLAYTPRARACYLGRSARTPADRELSGRVRIALDMVRGEVVAARILSSTLAHPGIEGCLREAAFALDIPRAYRNDDAVTAVLNLVFRPRTAEYRRPLERSEFDRELEMVIERAAEAPARDGGGAPDRD